MTPEQHADLLFDRFRAVMNKFCLDSDVKTVCKTCLEQMALEDPSRRSYYKQVEDALFENKVKKK